jgi:hypothetical protein
MVGGPLNSQARNCLGKGDPKFDVTMPNHQKEKEEEEVVSNGILILCNVETHFSIILFLRFHQKNMTLQIEKCLQLKLNCHLNRFSFKI